MLSLRSSLLPALGISVLFGLTAACGGNKQPAEFPATATETSAEVGSADPDPSATASAPATPTAASSKTDDGSDIIPPFSSSSEKKPATKGKGPKKTGGKSKKKG